MLATMRPSASTPTAPDHTQVHSQASTSQASSPPRTSRASSTPHATPAPADSPVKLSTSAKKNRSSHGGKKTSKKAMQQQQQNGQQPDPIASNTPGLITLSRPVDVPASPSRNKKTPRRAAAGSAIDGAATDHVASEPALLSRSAPAGSSRRHTKATTNGEGDAPALTWQQQLLGAGAASAATPTRSKAAKKHAGTSKSTAAASGKSLTWQQELFNGKSPRTGPHFDVFADSRDAETFGGGSDEDVGVNGKKSHKARRDHQLKTAMGDLSLDDVFGAGQKPASARRNNSNNNKQGNTTHGSPVTPAKSIAMNANHHQHHLAKSSASDEIAYAGPDFHNSPSAASLPAPQFMRQKDHCVKPTSALGANVTTSSDDDDEAERQRRRQDRGTTAPPALQPAAGASSGVSKSATIENLLAQMMGSAG